MRGAVNLIRDFVFLSTPSARRATFLFRFNTTDSEYFYPRPPRGGRPPARSSASCTRKGFLSTPSARRATDHAAICGRVVDISIHALCEEGDPLPTGQGVYCCIFLSTPSARRATVCGILGVTKPNPRGGRQL